MISPQGEPKVIEYNCRFGDPETQPIMMRMKSDLAALCLAAVEGRLDQCDSEWDERAAVGVVLAAGDTRMPIKKGTSFQVFPQKATLARCFMLAQHSKIARL